MGQTTNEAEGAEKMVEACPNMTIRKLADVCEGYCRSCILGVHDANKKGNVSQKICLALGFTMPHPARGVSFQSGFIARASTCGLNVNENIEEDRIESRSILSILLYNL